MLQQEYCAWRSSSWMLLFLGFARAWLSSPSGMLQSHRGAGRTLAAGGVPCKARLPANPTFPTTAPRQTPFPDFPHPLLTLTIPHLCPISKEPCPGGCRCPGSSFPGPAALLPYGIGATHGGCPRFPGAWGSRWHLLCLPVAKGVPVCPPPPLSRGVRPLETRICAAPGAGMAGARMRISAAHPVRWEREGLDLTAAHSVKLIN